jgi:hypothetical protein
MTRMITSTVIAVLLAGSAAFGSVDTISNVQQFSLALDSHLRIQGPGGLGVTSLTIPNLVLIQTAGINSDQVAAMQGISGTLGQTGHDANWGAVDAQKPTGATTGSEQTPTGSPTPGTESGGSTNSSRQDQVSVTWGSLPSVGAFDQSRSLLASSIPEDWLSARPFR